MPASHTAANSLSETEIQHIAAGIDAGRQPLVWFTADAVGMPAGQSGRVVALADPAELEYLHVKPTGSDDVLAFSPSELTLAKPARTRTARSRTRHHSTAESPMLFDETHPTSTGRPS